MSKKNWITWLLCGIMAITGASALTACGDKTDDSTPAASTPADSTPDESTPDESTPDESTPDESTPDESTPDESTPDTSTPDDSTPAVKKYTITFVDEDGTVISEESYEEGAAVVAPEDRPAKEADGYRYAFSGWGEVAATATADATYTAVYATEGVAIEYTISFNHPMTGMLLAQPITFTVETMDSIVFPEIPAELAQEGYTVSWDKTVEDVTLADLIVYPTAPVANNYQITYDANGGAAVEGQQVTFDAAYVLAEAPAREYYEFLGWYILEDGVATDTKLESGEAWAIADDVTVQAQWKIVEGEYAMKYNFNVADNPVTQITKQAYAGGSEVSFKYYVPEGTTAGWWGIAWHTDATQANNYHAAGIENAIGYYNLPQTVGAWVDVKFTLPADGEYYLYFGAEVNPNNKWVLNGGNSYALIDDFKIGELKEDFNGGMDDSIFAVNLAEAVTLGEGYYLERGEYAMKYNFNVTDNPVTQITKQAYAGGSEVSFKYYIPEGTTAGWWGIAWNSNAEHANNYHAAGVEANYVGHQVLGATTGAWIDVKFTLPTDGEYYLYFGAEVNPNNKWVLNGGNSYALIDDFKIGELKEDFNGGMDDSIFAVNVGDAVEIGEGYVAPAFEEGAYAMKYVFNISGEMVSQVTKKAYPAGSKVSFKYFIPEGVNAQWWGICWSDKNTGLDIYAAATNASANPLSKVIGAWTTVEFTLPSNGGDYYLYFGSEVGNWKFADGSNAYVLIDDFKVGEEVENFNKPFEENGMFNVLVPGAVVLSAKGEGAPDPIKGNTMLTFEATAISGDEKVAMITGKAYEGVSEITFDAVWTGNATSARWGLSYTTDPTKFSYGAEVSALNCYTPKLGELKMDVGVQYTYKLTFADGKYYLSAKAANASEFTDISSGDYTEGKNYFYIMVCPAVGGSGSIFYMDNFSITTTSGTVIDAFDNETATLFIESATNTSHYGSSGMSFIKSTFGEETEA